MEIRDSFSLALRLLPEDIRSAALASGLAKTAEELRLRTGRAPAILSGGTERVFMPGRPVTARDLRSVLEVATEASVHSAQGSLKRGFVTVRGGVRVGVCGAVIMAEGAITGIRELSSLSLRVPREATGCAGEVHKKLTAGGFSSTLLISPPGGGKTTLLRELIRLLSDGGRRVCLADERGEVAAVWEGAPQFDVGARTDIITGANKAEAAMMLLRAMNPEILAMDEITAPEDIAACEAACNCGVAIIATVHGGSLAELRARALHRSLLDSGVFHRAVVIKNARGARNYEVLEL